MTKLTPEATIRAELTALLAELDVLKADARRYRWLRSWAVYSFPLTEDGAMVWCVIGRSAGDCRPTDGEELDTYIDSALAQSDASHTPASEMRGSE